MGAHGASPSLHTKQKTLHFPTQTVVPRNKHTQTGTSPPQTLMGVLMVKSFGRRSPHPPAVGQSTLLALFISPFFDALSPPETPQMLDLVQQNLPSEQN